MNKPAATKVATATATPPAAPVATMPRATLVATYANKVGVEPGKLLAVLKDTAFKQPYKDGKPGPEVTEAQMMGLLAVANEYGLNPFLREIYAFPAKGGGIVPMVPIDGWVRIINNRPELASIAFNYAGDEVEKEDYWVECTITRRDRTAPLTVREYLKECYRNTDPWNEMPRRLLRHKALMQAARVAFGFGGIYDQDEADRIANAQAIDSVATEVRGKPATEEPRRIEAPIPPVRSFDLADLRRVLDDSGAPENALLAHYEVGSLEEFPAAKYAEAIGWLRGLNAAG